MRQERTREADLEPAARDRVEHADLARQLERMVETGGTAPVMRRVFWLRIAAAVRNTIGFGL
jgi:hypothetical protein